MRKSYVKILTLGAAVAVGIMASDADAKVTGKCDDCHTMHNSQNGQNWIDTQGRQMGDTPGRALTTGDCVGCHSSTTNTVLGGTSNNIPIVFSTGDPGTTILAGGNFYWVNQAGGDAKGHNVIGINSLDPMGMTPPGYRFDDVFAPTGGSKAGNNGTWTSQLTCAGTYGCHGKHSDPDDFRDISGAHHGGGTLDGSTVAQSYRFLMGITGIEDSQWEYAPNDVADVRDGGKHNVYKGKARNADTTDNVKETISFLCAECHGNFHSNSTGGTPAVDGMDDANFLSPWIRHPTDIDLKQANNYSSSEYKDYQFNHLWPVGVDTLASEVPGAKSTGSDSIVLCISCHRAHGTDEPDLLRWKYSDMSAHNKESTDANVGCFGCHTTKDNK